MSCIIIRRVRRGRIRQVHRGWIRRVHRGRRKLPGSRGISVAETLLCALILLLSTGVTVSALDLGIRHFQARTRETEQRLLCNTLSLAVQEYLTYANKVDPPEDDSVIYDLTNFRTGANSALESRVCKFVTGTYGKDANGREYCNPAAWGQIALEYSVDTNHHYYQLADKSQYITGHSANDVKLTAAIDVSVDRANRRFNVKIRVANTDNVRTQAIENRFIVIPINPGVFD